MKVFISWSGDRSKAVAELLKSWIKCVIQAARPWISSEDIDRGALWFTEINDQLRDITIGIICLTQQNKNKPWILFESGALAKGLSTSRVCTLLVDLEHKDLENPLAQFNHTLPTKNDMRKLVKTLNRHLGENALDDESLENAFNTYWPEFENKFKKALEHNPQSEKPIIRDRKNVLDEILEISRSTNNRISKIESRLTDVENIYSNNNTATFPMMPTTPSGINSPYISAEVAKMLSNYYIIDNGTVGLREPDNVHSAASLAAALGKKS